MGTWSGERGFKDIILLLCGGEKRGALRYRYADGGRDVGGCVWGDWSTQRKICGGNFR